MDYVSHSHKLGIELFNANPKFRPLWDEIDEAITSISEEEIIEKFEALQESRKNKVKSISQVINPLIKERLFAHGWTPESPIFAGEQFGNTWRLDFAKDHVSVEVGFNHGSDAAWNVVKPTLASQINHVEKKIQTELGVIVTATQEMKRTGGFDGAIGTFESYIALLDTMQNMVTVPLVIIGLKAPKSFHIELDTQTGPGGSKKKIGFVVRH